MIRPFVRMVLASAILAPIAMAGYPHTFELVPVDNSGVLPGEDPFALEFNDGSYYTYDLLVTTLGIDFTVADLEATLTGPGEFFQHAAGGDTRPDPNDVTQFPALEFDNYYDAGPGSDVYVIEPIIREPQLTYAVWYDLEAFLPNDTYRIARLTFQFVDYGEVTLSVIGSSADPSSGGTAIPIGPLDVTVEYIPEPGAFTLLALGGALALHHRTR